jgi:mono/diheme cytochrome c family protein
MAAVGQAAAATGGDHAQAVAALRDLRAAIGELVTADISYSTDRAIYRRASQRAINALAGKGGSGYVAAAGSSGDADGAIGHVDALLDRQDTPVWADPLHGGEANMRAAIVHLEDSMKARELMDYEIAMSRALTYLEVARGRATETGVFGGLEGALANTVLGVPAGARQVDACAVPGAAPAYGTHGGYLAWVAVPSSDGTHALESAPGGTRLTVHNGTIVLDTAAAGLVAKECRQHAATAPQPADPVATKAAATSDRVPALYTSAQAARGAEIFAGKCVSCHGTNLQGTAAPSVAGNDFLNTAKKNGWTLAVVRYLVVNNMPLNSAASLTPSQYADVMAFLLASDCYPAGSTPFPVAGEPSFTSLKLGPVPGVHPGENSFGVCKVE